MKYILATLLSSSFLLSSDFYYEYDKKVYIEKEIKNLDIKESRNKNSIQKYLTKEGQVIKFKNEIVLQCKKDKNCLKDVEDLGLKNIAQISKNFYLIKIESKENIFEVSQEIYELPSVEVAHPNFIKKRVFR